MLARKYVEDNQKNDGSWTSGSPSDFPSDLNATAAGISSLLLSGRWNRMVRGIHSPHVAAKPLVRGLARSPVAGASSPTSAFPRASECSTT